VINLKVDHEDHFNQVKFYKSFSSPDGTPYGVYVFCSGEFILKGDGGYINWGFRGSYKRNDNKVTFFSLGGKDC
jgi:hypothetical protein